MPEPTMKDQFNLLTKCAQKDDIDEIKASISNANKETSEKIDKLNDRVDTAMQKTDDNTDKTQK